MELLLLGGILAVALAAYGAIAWHERPVGPEQVVELRFDADVTPSAVEALWSAIAGLPSNAAVVLDVLADADGVRHFLRAAPGTLETLRSQWRGVLPSLRLDEVSDDIAVKWTTSASLRLSGRYAVLRQGGEIESSAAVLGSLQPLSPSEHVLVRWTLAPGRHPALPEPRSRTRRPSGLAVLLWPDPDLRPAHVRAVQTKHAGPVLAASGLVAVAAGHPKRAKHLLSRTLSPLRARAGAYGRFTVRRANPKRVARSTARLAFRHDIYAPAELVALTALPIEGPRLPGVALGTSPLLMPSRRIPNRGRVLAKSTWPGHDRLLAQPVVGALSHSLISGPSGVGKSSLIAGLAVQDLEGGRGFLFIDGKGDGADDVLARVPEGREVVVVDPAAGGPQPGLRLFAGGDPHLTADLILGVLEKVSPGEWGPTSARWLRAGLLLLAHAGDATLADLPIVFSNSSFRRRLVARVEDPFARETWAAFEQLSPGERAQTLAAPLGKLDEIVGRRVIRSVVGQSAPKLDLGRVLSDGTAVVVSLSPGELGAPAARLLGALIVHQFFIAVQARASLPRDARRPAFLYVDEPKALEDVPVPLDALYELARGLGCGVVMGAQSLTQLSTGLRTAATSNSATLVAFRQNAADARLLSPEFVGIEAEQLQHLGQYEIVMRMGLGHGDVTAPVSGRTLPLPAPTSDPELVRQRSAERYGADPAEVDAALARRYQSGSDEDPPVGFLRRSA
ncbi:MAG TPA: hypothetical protein VL988_06315 [Solirubrobacteraceae bacterium]|nr:hypothetical protein [Solirubrobacteraceae bacterium]